MDYLKFLSHRQSKLIFRSSNAISVYQLKSYRWILFNHKFIQTMIHIRKPHKMMLPYLESLLIFARIQPGPTLILGLGGGASIHILHKQHKSMHITVVEKYAEMIDLAKRFFFLPLSDHLELVCADANTYIKTCQRKFKHILIDLGDESGFPISCMHPDFFKQTCQQLTNDGILCLNVSNQHDISRFKSIFKHLYHQEPLIIYADGNWILCYSPHAEDYPLELLKRLNYVKTHVWRPHQGAYTTLRSSKLANLISLTKKLNCFNNIDRFLHHLD